MDEDFDFHAWAKEHEAAKRQREPRDKVTKEMADWVEFFDNEGRMGWVSPGENGEVNLSCGDSHDSLVLSPAMVDRLIFTLQRMKGVT